MRARLLILLLAVGVAGALLTAQARTTLDIYVVDVEGGNATLFVAPSGQSVLIDTGNGGAAAARDAGRIMDAAKDARLTQIDHLITTHWHGDHFGAMAELAEQIPIRRGPRPTVRRSSRQPAADEFLKSLSTRHCSERRSIRSSSRATASHCPGNLTGGSWCPRARFCSRRCRVPASPTPIAPGFKPQAPDPTENAHRSAATSRSAVSGPCTWAI